MIERACEVEVEADDEDRVTKLLQGRRIIVLSLLGEILQVVTHPTEPTAVFTSICCFDDKLLAKYFYFTESAGTCFRVEGMLALQGL